ncbi:TPA: amino acid permease, partial [Haemophilus influenzae]
MSDKEVKKSLTLRHIQFLALGSAIGTGLFYGSYESIKLAGSSVIFGYLIIGFIIYIIMKSLGDLILNTPTGKTFGDYASIYLGKKWGFVTGWAYALEMIIVCIADLTAFGIYMKFWYPEVDSWIWITILIFFIASINLVNVRVFGELEFILTIIKVIAIGFMIVIGVILLFYTQLNKDSLEQIASINNLIKYGGFFPNGLEGFIYSLSIIAFSFGGIEIIGISAGETLDPKKSIPIAIRSVPFRIIFFYIFTIFIILTIVPWNNLDGSKSPFVIIFEYIGIPYSSDILNIVIISASISAINSDIFSASRIIYSMSKRNQAPIILSRISKQGIPWVVVLLVSFLLCFGIFLNYLFPDKIFIFIASSASVITIFVWIIILFSNMFMNNNRLSSFIGFLQKNKFILFSIFSLVFIVLFMLLN